ncbi:MAG: toll/interleukin-1 receptor domain-containing protein [Hyphomicrobiales bacterium]|nr:MAG: toll/interleukin-1 receptor domain-containing protein [Hyphomicrobiales bacterium]
MPLREREIDEIIQVVTDRPYWGGGGRIFDALGIGDNWNVNRRANGALREHLRQLGDDQTEALLSYFDLRHHEHNDPVWPIKGLRLFVSHRDEQRANLALLGTALQRYGIAAFFAHDAIVAGRDWRGELLRGLGSMHALLAYCSPNFSGSDWTAQEVGFAFGKGVPVVSILAGENPTGFLEQWQGIRGVVNSEDTARNIAESVFERLSAADAAKEPLSEGLAPRLKFAGSFDAAGFISDRLVQVGRLSPVAAQTIRIAQAANNQVGINAELLALLGEE